MLKDLHIKKLVRGIFSLGLITTIVSCGSNRNNYDGDGIYYDPNPTVEASNDTYDEGYVAGYVDAQKNSSYNDDIEIKNNSETLWGENEGTEINYYTDNNYYGWGAGPYWNNYPMMAYNPYWGWNTFGPSFSMNFYFGGGYYNNFWNRPFGYYPMFYGPGYGYPGNGYGYGYFNPYYNGYYNGYFPGNYQPYYDHYGRRNSSVIGVKGNSYAKRTKDGNPITSSRINKSVPSAKPIMSSRDLTKKRTNGVESSRVVRPNSNLNKANVPSSRVDATAKPQDRRRVGTPSSRIRVNSNSGIRNNSRINRSNTRNSQPSNMNRNRSNNRSSSSISRPSSSMSRPSSPSRTRSTGSSSTSGSVRSRR